MATGTAFLHRRCVGRLRGVSPGGGAADLSTAVSPSSHRLAATVGLGRRFGLRLDGAAGLRALLKIIGTALATPGGSAPSAGIAGPGFGRHALAGADRRRGDRIEHRGEALLQLACIGARRRRCRRLTRRDSQRLQLVGLGAKPTTWMRSAVRLLLHRHGRRADIGVAGVAAVGDEHDVEALVLALRLGGIAQGRGDRGLALRLDLVEKLVLRREGQLAGLRQDLAVGAVRCLAMAEGDEPERQAAGVSCRAPAPSSVSTEAILLAPPILVFMLLDASSTTMVAGGWRWGTARSRLRRAPPREERRARAGG